MTGRKSFEISEAEMAELIALNTPGAGISISIDLERSQNIIETKSARQLVNEWWQRVGSAYGVDWATVKHRGERAFDGVVLL